MPDRNIPAKPGKFGRVNTQSILESLWGRIFTALEWEAIYEPEIILTDGRQKWRPDFILQGQRVLVECKPNIYGTLDMLAEDSEVLRAARCADSKGFTLFVGGMNFDKWDTSTGVCRMGLLMRGPLDVQDATITIDQGIKRYVYPCVGEHWPVPFASNICRFARNNDIFEDVDFPLIWDHCKNANQWKPKKKGTP